jgi:hypothetical protein
MQHDPTSDDAFASFLPGRQMEDDKALIVEFFVDKKPMGAKSAAAGKPIYEDREYVRIMIKGQDKQISVEEVKQHHKEKFPIAYMRFQQQKPAPVIGTPIEMLPGIGPSMAHHLKGLNLRSVEDVSNVSDENVLQAMGAGARDLVKRAKAWIEQSSEKTQGLQAQLAEERAARERERKEFEDRLAALEAKKAPKKSRKTEGAPA